MTATDKEWKELKKKEAEGKKKQGICPNCNNKECDCEADEEAEETDPENDFTEWPPF